MCRVPRLWLPRVCRRARGSASTSAHQSSEESSCGCDHERWTTAWRACSIAVTSRDTSGRLMSSRAKLAAVIRGGSPEGQRGLPHAPDVGLGESERSAGQLPAFVLGNIPDLSSDCLGDVPRPPVVCVQRYDPQRPLVLAMQQVLDDGGGVRLDGVGLNIRETRSAKVAKDEMQVRIKGW